MLIKCIIVLLLRIKVSLYSINTDMHNHHQIRIINVEHGDIISQGCQLINEPYIEMIPSIQRENLSMNSRIVSSELRLLLTFMFPCN